MRRRSPIAATRACPCAIVLMALQVLAVFDCRFVAYAQTPSESLALQLITSSMFNLPPEWLSETAPNACTAVGGQPWSGLTCVNGKVTQIVINSDIVEGYIPEGISGLTNLKALEISATLLTGGLPTGLCSLTSLTDLNIFDNTGLRGPIPSCIGTSLTNLTRLVLAGSKFNSTIPTTLGSLPLLQTLSLERNQFSGPVPPHLGNLTQLGYLSLANNRLDGTLPGELSKLNNLMTLWLSNNNFSSSLPLSYGDFATLHVFYVANNPLLSGCFIEPGGLAPNECDIVGSPICSCRQRQCNPACADCVPCLGNPPGGPPQLAPQAAPALAPQIAPQASPQVPPQAAPAFAPQSAPQAPTQAVAPAAPSNVVPLSAPDAAPETSPTAAVSTTNPSQAPENAPVATFSLQPSSPACAGNCIGPVTLGGSSGQTGITITNTTTVQGNFIVQTPNVTVSIIAQSAGSPLAIEGCATFNGRLNVSVGENLPLSGTDSLALATFAGGYCGGGEPSRFSELGVDLGCRTSTSQDLQYQQNTLTLLLGGVDSSNCESATTSPLTSTIVVAVVVPIVVVLGVIIALLIVFRRKIIPAYRFEDSSKVELQVLSKNA